MCVCVCMYVCMYIHMYVCINLDLTTGYCSRGEGKETHSCASLSTTSSTYSREEMQFHTFLTLVLHCNGQSVSSPRHF